MGKRKTDRRLQEMMAGLDVQPAQPTPAQAVPEIKLSTQRNFTYDNATRQVLPEYRAVGRRALLMLNGAPAGLLEVEGGEEYNETALRLAAMWIAGRLAELLALQKVVCQNPDRILHYAYSAEEPLDEQAEPQAAACRLTLSGRTAGWLEVVSPGAGANALDSLAQLINDRLEVLWLRHVLYQVEEELSKLRSPG